MEPCDLFKGGQDLFLIDLLFFFVVNVLIEFLQDVFYAYLTESDTLGKEE